MRRGYYTNLSIVFKDTSLPDTALRYCIKNFRGVLILLSNSLLSLRIKPRACKERVILHEPGLNT
jgi:hypothetical protein